MKLKLFGKDLFEFSGGKVGYAISNANDEL